MNVWLIVKGPVLGKNGICTFNVPSHDDVWRSDVVHVVTNQSKIVDVSWDPKSPIYNYIS